MHTVDWIYPPTLEVSHHVSALGNLGGSVEAHVGVLSIDHVLLEKKKEKTIRKPDETVSQCGPFQRVRRLPEPGSSTVPAQRIFSKKLILKNVCNNKVVTYNQCDDLLKLQMLLFNLFYFPPAQNSRLKLLNSTIDLETDKPKTRRPKLEETGISSCFCSGKIVIRNCIVNLISSQKCNSIQVTLWGADTSCRSTS